MKSNKCGTRTLSGTGHTIFAATHPGMYKFFNVPEDRKHMPMAAATTYVVLNNTAGRQVMDKLVNCSITKECMALIYGVGDPNYTKTNMLGVIFGYC
uniref:Uncharacterized protein n=1 Tax=Panagrolaimus sp. JU765 TaxID=591449 RepID=A0AC34Q2D1_9BILA